MLKPPVNVRDIDPPSCHSCRDRVPDENGEGSICARDPDQTLVAFDGESIYTTICDRFRR